MLLVYTHKITNRFSYTARHLFTRILGVEVDFTTKVEDFIKHKGPKITYTKKPLQNEFFIRSNDLLFEQGINDVALKLGNWDGLPCFFEAGERSNVPFDIFAASFYLLSRYEEYLPHVKDHLGRFPPETGLAHQEGFLERPLVDLWSKKLLRSLQERFPDLMYRPKTYRFTSIINVTSSHSYALRGFSRGFAGFVHDLGRFKLRRLARRWAVWFDPKKDPFDNFSSLIAIHKRFKMKTMFFFQFADYSRHDKNISIHKNKFRFLIKSIADYSRVSLSASMASSMNNAILIEEKARLSQLINRPVNSSRMRYNKVVLPETYRNLVEAEFTDDYSMGFTHRIGYRAGTSSPFYFYDINLEVQQPIKIHPFAFCDHALVNCTTKDEVFALTDPLFDEAKQVGSDFVMVFSNQLLGSKHKINWLELYEAMVKRYYV